MRYRGAVRGLRRLPLLALAALSTLASAACEEPEPEGPPLDPLLRDSLPDAEGIGLRIVEIGFGSRGEELVPDSLEIRVGDRVDFRTLDGSPRVARFRVMGLDEDQYRFLTDGSGLMSPPLVAAGSHWIVHFERAPAGRYPFEVEGPLGTVEGVLWVGPPGT
ncbi:MAG TPA: hypothetical protein VK858_18175 [Longimicrobiales bacterium]|nr:hypothetical protein [Longimicrobiales bacterium]